MTELVETVECPGCGTRSPADPNRRDASEFCPKCDFPLFWARERVVDLTGGPSTDDGAVRRLPGTAGRALLAGLVCPACTEHNVVTAQVCVRCGADLHPAPVVPVQRQPEPVPEPEPEPVAEPFDWTWWLVAAGLLLLGAVVLIVLLVD